MNQSDDIQLKNARIATELYCDIGYGIGVAQGLGRFRAKRPDWLFLRCRTNQLKNLRQNSFAGALGHYYMPSQFKQLEYFNVPYYVSVSRRAEWAGCAQVVSDDIAVGRMAAEYFMHKKYHHFAVLNLAGLAFSHERTKGFVDCLKAEGHRDVLVLKPPLSVSLEVVARHRPLALFATADSVALNAINHLIEAGFRVPEDVAVLGCDDDQTIMPYTPVPLSSIQLPLEKIGFSACELLESMIASGKREQGLFAQAPLGVVERRSTAAMAVPDERVRRAQAYMVEHLREVENMTTVAAALRLNKRTLERLFERHVGLSPAEWIMRHRADYAESLLTETDYTVDHIADLAGFGERSRLYRSFHRLGRALPSRIRATRQVSGRLYRSDR